LLQARAAFFGKIRAGSNRAGKGDYLNRKGNISKHQELPFASFEPTVTEGAARDRRLGHIDNLFPDAIASTAC
jgi:hypothetical protein